MFVVTEADAATILAVYQQRGEDRSGGGRAAPAFPGIADNAQARECVRMSDVEVDQLAAFAKLVAQGA